jgi:hypothetical protein
MALVAEELGAMIARPDPPSVRQLAMVHRVGALSLAAARFAELAVTETNRAPSPVTRQKHGSG